MRLNMIVIKSISQVINSFSTKSIVFVQSWIYVVLNPQLTMIKNSSRHMIIRKIARGVIPLLFSFVLFSTQSFAQIEDSTSQKDSISISLPISENAITSVVNCDAVDTIIFSVKEKKMFLYNTAVVTYEDMKLEADFIEVDFDKNEIHATGLPDSNGVVQGKPIFTTDGNPFNADEMWYNFKTKKGVSTGVVTTQDGGLIRGDKILKDSNDNMYIRHATYTTCNAEHPHFWIAANKFKVIPEKRVISGPANLVIAGINTPIILPFGLFPIQKQRTKGLVVGSFDQQDRWGYGLRDFGFYTPVNDKMDLLLSADFYLRGSYGFAVKSNYKKRYRYSGHVLFKYNKFLEGEKETPEFTTENNYRLEWLYRQDQRAKPGRTFSADVRYITQNQQKFTSTDPNAIIQNTATSSVAYSRSFANRKVFLTTNARITQDLDENELDMQLPEMNINVQRLQPFKNMKGGKDKYKVLRNFGFTYSTAFKNNVVVNQDSIIRRREQTLELNPTFLSSIRNGVKHTASVNTSFNVFKYFNISPNASLTDFWYFKTIDKTWDTDSVLETDVKGFERAAAYNVGFDINTIVYGNKSFAKGKVKAIRHIIRPRVGMSWSPDFQNADNGVFRQYQSDSAGTISPYSIFENGIYGGPSGTGNGSIDFSINNNLEMKIRTPRDTSNGGEKKVKLIESFGISSGYNMLADSLKLRSFSISGFTTIFQKVRVNFSTRLDPYQFAYDSASNRNVSIDKLAIAEGSLGQFTSRSLQLSTSLNPDALKRRPNNADGEFVSGMDYFMDFSIPWDLSLNFSSTYTKSITAEEATRDQTLMFNGNVKLTEYWKIGFRSGYNFTQNEVGITSIDFARDLHCWVFNFHWIPTGIYRQFNFELKVKAAMLKDLKIKRREQWQNLDN